MVRFAGSIFQKFQLKKNKDQYVEAAECKEDGPEGERGELSKNKHRLSLGHVETMWKQLFDRHLPKSPDYKRGVVAKFRLARLLLPKSKWSLVYTNSFIKYVNITTVNYRWIIGSP